ncbi:MAG: helix-turn-helix transcriptional regulator [Patescibacteria group bacterium]
MTRAKYITHGQVLKEMLKDKKFSREYFRDDPAYDIGRMVEDLRIRNGLTQAALAKKISTKQSSIARLESGDAGLPSLSFLKRIADATGTILVLPSFAVKVPLSTRAKN